MISYVPEEQRFERGHSWPVVVGELNELSPAGRMVGFLCLGSFAAALASDNGPLEGVSPTRLNSALEELCNSTPPLPDKAREQVLAGAQRTLRKLTEHSETLRQYGQRGAHVVTGQQAAERTEP